MIGEKGWYELLLEMLPEGWEAKAKELGAMQRARVVRTPGELLRLILLYLTEGKSLAGTVALAGLSGIAEISKVAMFKRLRNSKDWLKWLGQNVYRRAGLTAAKPEWLKGREVLLVDGSEDVKCGVRRQCYMLHYSLDLFTLEAREFLVTDISTGERLSNFTDIRKGDIVVGDRAYGNMPGIAHVRKFGADFALRMRGWKHAFFDGENGKMDMSGRLSALKEGETADIPAKCLVNGQYEPVRVCVLRKDAESEKAGLKRLRKENQRKQGGKPVSQAQMESNRYVVVATSLGVEVSSAQVMELYRARWQIEIAFKRLKSLFAYNDVPMDDRESAFAWFYGKLLLAALCETLVNTGRFSPSERARE